jgi:hypothetical protein
MWRVPHSPWPRLSLVYTVQVGSRELSAGYARADISCKYNNGSRNLLQSSTCLTFHTKRKKTELELCKSRKESVMADFRVFHQHFFVGAKENHKNLSKEHHPMDLESNSEPPRCEVGELNRSDETSTSNALAWLEANNCMSKFISLKTCKRNERSPQLLQ